MRRTSLSPDPRLKERHNAVRRCTTLSPYEDVRVNHSLLSALTWLVKQRGKNSKDVLSLLLFEGGRIFSHELTRRGGPERRVCEHVEGPASNPVKEVEQARAVVGVQIPRWLVGVLNLDAPLSDQPCLIPAACSFLSRTSANFFFQTQMDPAHSFSSSDAIVLGDHAFLVVPAPDI